LSDNKIKRLHIAVLNPHRNQHIGISIKLNIWKIWWSSNRRKEWYVVHNAHKNCKNVQKEQQAFIRETFVC